MDGAGPGDDLSQAEQRGAHRALYEWLCMWGLDGFYGSKGFVGLEACCGILADPGQAQVQCWDVQTLGVRPRRKKSMAAPDQPSIFRALYRPLPPNPKPWSRNPELL